MEPKAILPVSVVSPGDVARLKRALERHIELATAARLKTKAGVATETPKVGKVLAELANGYGCDLAKQEGQEALLKHLDTLLTKAPAVAMSFAADPSSLFMNKIVSWLRTNIHPMLLIKVGLQPSIAAGCTLRTTSKLYDFSLKNSLRDNKHLLIEGLHAKQEAPRA